MTAEDRLQAACITWFRLQYPQLRMLLFAVPNGGKREHRTVKTKNGYITYSPEAKKLKATGVIPGVADLIFLLSRQGYNNLLIEMKTPTGSQSPEQRDWQVKAEAAGSKYVVCRSVEEFIATINQYLENGPNINIRAPRPDKAKGNSNHQIGHS